MIPAGTCRVPGMHLKPGRYLPLGGRVLGGTRRVPGKQEACFLCRSDIVVWIRPHVMR
jgi:hypothetical protein